MTDFISTILDLSPAEARRIAAIEETLEKLAELQDEMRAKGVAVWDLSNLVRVDPVRLDGWLSNQEEITLKDYLLIANTIKSVLPEEKQ